MQDFKRSICLMLVAADHSNLQVGIRLVLNGLAVPTATLNEGALRLAALTGGYKIAGHCLFRVTIDSTST